MPRWTTRLSLLLSSHIQQSGTVGLTGDQALRYGQDNIKVYKSSFASMYSAVTKAIVKSLALKLITAGADEKLHLDFTDLVTEWMR